MELVSKWNSVYLENEKWDSDSDISLGTHSPPLSSPNPLRYSSPTPISTFRFGPHSPGPMPAQYRFGNHSPPAFRLDRQSSPNSNLKRLGDSNSPVNLDNSTSNFRLDRNAPNNLRMAVSESPINVDSSTDFRSNKNSPIRVDMDNSPPQTSLQHSPPINLRVNPQDSLGLRIHPETPMPLRLGATTPLRIQVTMPSKMTTTPSPQTSLHMGETPHGIGGIVRIAPPSPANPPPLHRPFSPPRLT
ncbi:hypothetical protein ILUMI_12145 [Ignelater luminosus]|uniref:Uncharacterized protein n=1 Tax=Ignelater luminosus TaxID=2038154 RepID=A0A8K0GC30_IGNLU|nr:hypothetical protein ILUMI_12145 [Ignelater luminosus]